MTRITRDDVISLVREARERGERPDLRGVDLRGVNLRHANLYGANLVGAGMYGANLCNARWDGLVIDGLHPCRILLIPTADGGGGQHWLLVWDTRRAAGADRRG